MDHFLLVFHVSHVFLLASMCVMFYCVFITSPCGVLGHIMFGA